LRSALDDRSRRLNPSPASTEPQSVAPGWSVGLLIPAAVFEAYAASAAGTALIMPAGCQHTARAIQCSALIEAERIFRRGRRRRADGDADPSGYRLTQGIADPCLNRITHPPANPIADEGNWANGVTDAVAHRGPDPVADLVTYIVGDQRAVLLTFSGGLD